MISVAASMQMSAKLLASATRTSLFTPGDSPGTWIAGGSAVALGVLFNSSVDGDLTAFRFWKDAADSGVHTGNLHDSSGTWLAGATFSGESASGWQEQALASPYSIDAETDYVVSIHMAAGGVGYDFNFFNGGHTSGVLTAPANPSNGRYAYSATATTYPSNVNGNVNYWADFVLET